MKLEFILYVLYFLLECLNYKMLVKCVDKTNDLKMNKMFKLSVEIILIRIFVKVVKMNSKGVLVDW